MKTVQFSLHPHSSGVVLQVAIESVIIAQREGRRYMPVQVVVIDVPRLLTEEIAAELQREKITLPVVRGVNVSVLEIPGVSETIHDEWVYISLQELEVAEKENRDLRCAAYNRMLSVSVELARQLLVENGLLEPVQPPTP